MTNVVFWDVASCVSCQNRHFGGICLLITANIPQSPILSTQKMEVTHSSETLVLTSTQPHIPEDGIINIA
jgi:hypothetical protein